MRGFDLRILLALTMALATAGGAQAQLRYRVETISVLGPDNADSYSWAFGLNNHGTVVGYASTQGDEVPFRAFVYEKGQIRGLGNLGGLTTAQADGINDRGQIVGYAADWVIAENRPFLYERGQLKDLNPDPGFGSAGYAHAINESGHVAGTMNGRAYVHDGTQPRFIPFELEDLGTTIAWGINDHGVVVGRTEYGLAHSFAFVWDGSSLSYLPIPQGAADWIIEGKDINNAGQIVVQANDRAYLYEGGAYQALGTLSGGFTSARAINEKGWIVGESEVASGVPQPSRAFLWRNGRMRDLNTLLDPGAAQHWTLHYAMDVNDRGQIVGLGMVDGLTRAFIATPVSEPDTWALLLAGLGSVGAVAWRRRPGARD